MTGVSIEWKMKEWRRASEVWMAKHDRRAAGGSSAGTFLIVRAVATRLRPIRSTIQRIAVVAVIDDGNFALGVVAHSLHHRPAIT